MELPLYGGHFDVKHVNGHEKHRVTIQIGGIPYTYCFWTSPNQAAECDASLSWSKSIDSVYISWCTYCGRKILLYFFGVKDIPLWENCAGIHMRESPVTSWEQKMLLMKTCWFAGFNLRELMNDHPLVMEHIYGEWSIHRPFHFIYHNLYTYIYLLKMVTCHSKPIFHSRE